MRKINKSPDNIFAKTYKAWVDKFEEENKEHPGSKTYYDDIVMNLFKCQKGVCAYTEMNICPEALYGEANWKDDRYILPNSYKRNDHLGELDHFDPSLKKKKYWLWSNLFVIEAKINSIKLNKPIVDYLKPDLENYKPELYFDYDDQTHQFIPNTELADENKIKQIQYMIDEVLCLNHGWIKKARENFINDIKFRIKHNLDLKPIDQFFTATDWTLNGKP